MQNIVDVDIRWHYSDFSVTISVVDVYVSWIICYCIVPAGIPGFEIRLFSAALGVRNYKDANKFAIILWVARCK
jgi:hypothetical protein